MTTKQVLFLSLSLFTLISVSDFAFAQNRRFLRTWTDCEHNNGNYGTQHPQPEIDRMEAECNADENAKDKRACTVGVLWLRQEIADRSVPSDYESATKFLIDLWVKSTDGCRRGEGQGIQYESCLRGIELSWNKRNLPQLSYR